MSASSNALKASIPAFSAVKERDVASSPYERRTGDTKANYNHHNRNIMII